MEIKVTQADREAAADFYRDYMAKPGEWVIERHLREGVLDAEGVIQSYTRHRISSQAELIEALEQIIRRGDHAASLSALAYDMRKLAKSALAKTKGEV